MKKKVAILGYVDHFKLAPFNDPEFEIWGINDLFNKGIPKWDRWFQIHHPEHYGVAEGRMPINELLPIFATWDCPVYLWQEHPQIPHSKSFPFEELVKEYGRYFNNTISWLIAFAIHEGFEEIHVYGVDMSHDTEYGHQKPSCEYFLGLAAGKGIKIHVPDESDLLKTKYLYAYEQALIDTRHKRLDQKIQMVQQNATAIAQELERLVSVKSQYEGALRALQEVKAKDL